MRAGAGAGPEAGGGSRGRSTAPAPCGVGDISLEMPGSWCSLRAESNRGLPGQAPTLLLASLLRPAYLQPPLKALHQGACVAGKVYYTQSVSSLSLSLSLQRLGTRVLLSS